MFAEEDYVYTWKNYKGPNAPLNYVYNGKDPDSDYNVYPLVKWMGIEMIADNTTIIGKWKGDDDLAYEFKADNTFISYEYGHYFNDIEVIAETHGTYTISSDGKYIDFHDEYDEKEDELVQKISDREYIIEGSMHLDDVNDHLDTELDSEDYDSLGGFIIEHLDRLPVAGDEVITEDGIRLIVEKLDKNRIEKVHVYLPEKDPETLDNTES